MTDNFSLNVSANFENEPNTTIHISQYWKKGYLKGTNFAFVFLDLFDNLASDKELNLTDIRVLCGLLGNLDFGNQISISQSKLAKDIGIAQQHISTSINKLIKKGYLTIIAKNGRQNVYWFNMHCALKGSPADWNSLKKFWNERQETNKEQSAKNSDVN
jgi:Firmicute plasmid replication protein (RepL)